MGTWCVAKREREIEDLVRGQVDGDAVKPVPPRRIPVRRRLHARALSRALTRAHTKTHTHERTPNTNAHTM